MCLRAGQPQLPLLNAVGIWLGQQVQAALKSTCHMYLDEHLFVINYMRAGQPQLPLLNAAGTWLGLQVQAAMKSETNESHLL
jgi:hypothetical protein